MMRPLPPRRRTDFCVDFATADVAARVYDLVWRFDFDTPGFALVDLGSQVDSHELRARIVDLKEQLSQINVARGRPPFRFRSLARFDQQVTTKFHLDGAPLESMLILGYEPSRVVSRLYLGDYTHAAFDVGITPQEFLNDWNPMFKKGEELLEHYATELPQPLEGHARILVVNNSTLPYTESRTHPLGVMHKAVIAHPNEAERRIVNSTMVVVEGDEVGVAKQEEFVRTETISQRIY